MARASTVVPAMALGPALAIAMLGACTTSARPPSPAQPSAASPASSTDGRTTSPSASEAGGSLRWALSGDPTSLDPAFAEDEAAQLVVDALFDSLTRLDADLRPVPSTATRWSVTPDQRTWTFEISADARFHDGRPVVAADFVRAFNRITDGTRPTRSYLGYLLGDVEGFAAAEADGAPLTGVGVDGDGRLVVELVRPDADLASVLSHPSLGPVPPDVDDNPFAWGDNPVGNGPFRMAEPWAHDQFIRLTRADEDRARLDEVLFRIYGDDPGLRQQWADFAADQLHVARVPAAERRNALATWGTVRSVDGQTGVVADPWTTTYHFGFNTLRAPFDDPVVRRAVSLLIDRERVATDIMRSSRRPADRLLPPGMVGSRPNSCTWCVHDPEAAKALLAEAGIVLDPEQLGPIVLLHTKGATDAAVAEVVAAAIREHLGLEVEVRELGVAGYARAVQAGEGHLFRSGWTAEHGMPGAMLTPMFHSRNVGGDNDTGFADPEVDRLLDQAAGTAGLRERLALYAQAEQRIEDLVPVAPVLTYELGRIVDEDVVGFRMDPLGRVDLAVVGLTP